MIGLGPVSDFLIRVLGRELAGPLELLIVAVGIVVLVVLLHEIYQRLLPRKRDIHEKWAKPPPKESQEITRMRERGQNKF